MKKTMEKLTRGATRLLVLALGLGLTATGWGAASLEETGATVPTTATLAFKGAKLSQVTANTLSGVIGGDWAGNIAGNAMTFNNFDRTSEASGTITCQAQIQHDSNIKGVLLTFTQDGSNVKVQKTGAKYISGTVGSSIAGGTDGYYDVSKLQLTLTKPKPLAVFDGASGGFKKSSVNGVTFTANGNTVAEDGSYVKISAAVGALFKLDTGYSYVIGEFTVTNLNESASGERVLALWSPNNLGTGYTVGTVLKTETVSTYGIWNSGGWNRDSGTQNSTLATGISVDASRTFALAAEDSKVNNVQNDTGTHLFELTGASPGTAVYGGTGNLGLRGDQTYQTLAIGGPATGSLVAMTGLVITKVVIYASNTRQFTSTDPTTIANVENPAAFYVGNGETINASTINAGVEAFGSAYVYTEAGATLNLNAELNGHAITFAGSISGVPGSADGLTLGSANDSVTTTVAANVPNIKGSGTVVYNGVAPDTSYSWMTASAWNGVLWLKNLAIAGLVPANLASANSTLRLTGCTGYFNNGGNTSTCPGTLDLQDDGSTKAFTVNNGWSASGVSIFNKLTGAGTLACSTKDISQRYVFKDPSEFTGTINCVRTDDASKKYLRVILGNSTDGGDNGTITVASGASATVKTGKTWSANKVVVNGTLNMEDSTAALSGTVSGGGKIVYNDELPNSADFTANTWTGTVEVNGGVTTAAGIVAADAAQFMNPGSAFTVATGTVMLDTAAGLTGTVNVNSGATLQVVDDSTASLSLAGVNSGTINLQMATALTTLTLSDGIARGTVVYPSSLTTLNVALKETVADDGEYSVSCGSATPTAATLTLTRPDGTTVEEVAGTIEGSTVSFSWTPAVSGKACWVDYEMEYESGNASKTGFENSGTDTTGLHSDSGIEGDNAFYNGMLYTYAHPWRDMTGNNAYPSSWTAVVRCTVPAYENAAIITFGTCGGGLIGLVAGADPETQMKLVKTTGNSAFTVLSTMTVQNATTAQHVYVFEVENNSTIKVYCDGEEVLNETYSAFTLGGGIQIGSVHGGVGNTGIIRFAKNESPANTLSETVQKNARIDCVRLYKTVLGPNAIRQLSVEFPAVKLYRATIAADATTTWDALTWSPAWDGGNAYSKIILTAAGDGTLTLPESITAEDFKIDVASGHVLTLNRAAGGTTITTTNPMEVDNGAIYLADDSTLGGWEIGGTGNVRLKNGATITGALSGTAKVEIPSGANVMVTTGSIANPITGAGGLVFTTTRPASALSFSSWTGIVQIPAITTDEAVNFNYYGVAGSTVYVTSMSAGWLADAEVLPELYLLGNMTLNHFSASFANTIDKLSGVGTFSLAADGTADGYVDGYFLVKDVSDFEGSISVAAPGLAIGSAKPASPTTYGQIVLTTTATIPASKTWTASNGIVLGSADATLTNTDGALATAPTTSVADSYVKLTGTTYSVDAYNVVTFVQGNSTVTRTDALGTAIKDGDTITFTVTPDAGYNLVSVVPSTGSLTGDGPYSYTVTGDVTITVTTQQKTATVSGVTFTYGADYTTATVTAAVTGDATSATLSYDGHTYNANVVNGTVTFNNVAVTRGNDIYAATSYTVTTDAGETTGGSGTSVAADTTAWFSQSAAAQTGGSWSPAISFEGGSASLEDNTFTATTASASDLVVLDFDVCFGAVNADDVDGNAQAAIKIGEVNSEPTFMVLTNGSQWAAVSGVTPDVSATYKVVLTINYKSNTYGVTVNGTSVRDGASNADFALARTTTSAQVVDFVGSGTLTAMKGEQVDGNMASIGGTKYATVDDAIRNAGQNDTITLLHDTSNVPSGWKKVGDGFGQLVRVLSGFFMLVL